MAEIPATAMVWAESMDPYDITDYTIDLTNLLEGDSVDTYSVEVRAESALLGLQIANGSGYGTTLTNNVIRIWLSVDPAKQASIAFDGTGVLLPLDVNVVTTSVPKRRRQRTAAVRVVQR